MAITHTAKPPLSILSSAEWNAAHIGTLDHLTEITNVGVNTHAQIDAHIADNAVHFTEASISHLNIQNIGVHTHAELDAFMDTTVPTSYWKLDSSNSPSAGDWDHHGNFQIRSHLAVGNTAAIVPNSAVYVFETYVDQGDYRGLTCTAKSTFANQAPDYFYSLAFESIADHNAGTFYRLVGILGYSKLTGTGDLDAGHGGQFYFRNYSSGNVNEGIGVQGGVVSTGSGTINYGYNFVTATTIEAGTVVDWVGLRVRNPSVSGTGSITTGYGIYIGNLTSPITSWGIYQVGVQPNQFAGNVHLIGQKELRFYEDVNYVGFEAPALTSNQIWVLPSADGSVNQFMQTDGAGNLSFSGVAKTTRVVHFQDCRAADDDYIGVGPWEDGYTISDPVSPDVPRNVSVTVQAIGEEWELTTGIVTVNFINADNAADSEAFTFILLDNWLETQYGVKGAAVVTSVVISEAVGAGNFWVGISDKLSPSSSFAAAADVFKVKKNNANIAIPAVDATYGTVDCATITGGDDFTFWFRK